MAKKTVGMKTEKKKSYAEMTREERVMGVKETDKESREYKATHKEKT